MHDVNCRWLTTALLQQKPEGEQQAPGLDNEILDQTRPKNQLQLISDKRFDVQC